MKLDPSFDVKLEGIDQAPNDLQDAISRTKYHLLNDNFERLIVGRAASDHNNLENAPRLSTLELSLHGGVQSIMHEAIKPLGSRTEGYALSIPATGGSARISANSTLGLFRGLTTFEQLFYFDGECTVYTYQAPIQIYDAPTYVSHTSIHTILDLFQQPYRGFMLDTSRNLLVINLRILCLLMTTSPSFSFPVNDIKRTLDAMSMVKVGSFHSHTRSKLISVIHADEPVSLACGRLPEFPVIHK